MKIRNSKVLFNMEKSLFLDTHRNEETISDIIKDENTTLYKAIESKSDTSSIVKQVSELMESQHNINIDLDEIKGAQKSFQLTLDSFSSTLNKLNGQFIDLNAKFNTIQEDVTSIDNEVSDISEEIKNLISRQLTSENNIKNLNSVQTTQSSQIQDLTKRVKKLEDTVISVNLPFNV